MSKNKSTPAPPPQAAEDTLVDQALNSGVASRQPLEGDLEPLSVTLGNPKATTVLPSGNTRVDY